MQIIIYLIFFGLMVFVTYKNFSLILRYKHNAAYIEAYKKVLANSEDSLSCLENFIEKEKKMEFIQKGTIVKLFYELNNDLDYDHTLQALDLRKIFENKKGKFVDELVNLNSDSFVFLVLCICKAYDKNDEELLKIIKMKLQAIAYLQNHLEYLISFKLLLMLLDDKEDLQIFRDLLTGSYTGYKYDKNIIGLFKRISACVLVYKKEEIEEYYKNDLFSFNKTKIGSLIMHDLKLADSFVKEEVVQ